MRPGALPLERRIARLVRTARDAGTYPPNRIVDCDLTRLEIDPDGSKIGPMSSRLLRVVILLAVTGVAYAGPVATCLCLADPVDEMPCCPDDVQQQDQSNALPPESAAAVACDTVPADLLRAGTDELPPPAAVSAALSPWSVHGPPASSIAVSPPLHDSRPIYLITLRLRI